MFIISPVSSKLITILFIFYLPPPLCVCFCVVCGSYSVSEGWNGDHSLDQGKNSNTLQYGPPHVLHLTQLPINKKPYRQEKHGKGCGVHRSSGGFAKLSPF